MVARGWSHRLGFVLLTWLAMTSFALAQESAPTEQMEGRDAQARAAYQIAAAAFTEGQFERALTQFQRAYELSPRPQLLFNIGTTHDRLRHSEPALQAFERYLAAVPDAPNRASVLARLDALRADVERDRALAESLQLAQANRDSGGQQPNPDDGAQQRRTRRRWIGGISGAVALVAGAIIIGVMAGGSSSRPYEQGSFGVSLALTGAL